MEKIKVSVVVPVFNTEKYLRECLDAIVNQSLTDIEVICVNDGSTDSSANIIEEYKKKDSRIRLISNKKSSGSGAHPRNLGLQEAKGKYVIFWDSDDYFDRKALEKMYLRAEETSSDLVLCDNYRTDEHGRPLDESEYHSEIYYEYVPDKDVFSHKDCPDCIFQLSNAAAWHRLIRKDLLTENDLFFQENVPVLDDIYFVNSVIFFAKRISIVKEKLVYYRLQRPGAQTTAIQNNYSSVFFAFNALQNKLEMENDYEVVRNSLDNWILATMNWWQGNIVDLDISRKLFYLYKNEYFPKLDLKNMLLGEVRYNNRWFFISVMLDEYRPSLQTILTSVLPEHGKIVIYGAGKHGQTIVKKIKEHGKHTVELWCDINHQKLGDEISNPSQIKKVRYDLVLISIINSRYVWEAEKYLLSMGIDKKNIYRV